MNSFISAFWNYYDNYVLTKRDYELAYQTYKDYISYAEEINRQMNEKFGQGDTYNGNILKNHLNNVVYPKQTELGLIQANKLSIFKQAENKYLVAKAKLSAAQQAQVALTIEQKEKENPAIVSQSTVSENQSPGNPRAITQGKEPLKSNNRIYWIIGGSTVLLIIIIFVIIKLNK